MRETPYYHLVPKGLEANLEFRKEMVKKGCESRKYAEELWIMCKRDPLFYINTFVFTYNPRLGGSKIVPFITYSDFQDEAILVTDDAIQHQYDMLTEKSREMGATWIYLTVFQWRWNFYPLESYRVVSRNQNLVDKTGNPDSLFWKLMFVLDHLPGFLRPSYDKNFLSLRNNETGSMIDGEATTQDIGRGGRCTGMLVDEFAAFDINAGYKVLSSTRDVTGCRIFNSTPKGTGNAFYDLSQSKIRKLRFHWSDHPVKKRGLYSSDDERLNLIDTDFTGEVRVGRKKYDFPDDYPFIRDGKLRSPWYDYECQRAAHPMEIPQELDIDYLGSDYQFFDGTVLQKIQATDVRPPVCVGELDIEPESKKPKYFSRHEKGRLRLWVEVNDAGELLIDDDKDFVVGIDVATGTGASNSVICVSDRVTNTDVAEFVSPNIPPEDLASVAVAIARWFNNAYMIWEANGPGRIFGNNVLEIGYPRIYYRRRDESINKKTTDCPGWFSTREYKAAMLGDLRKSMGNGGIVVRSHRFIKECEQYVYTSNGAVEHANSKNTIDPSGAKDNHGDIVIAKGLVNKVLREYKRTVEKESPAVPKNCFAARRQRHLKRTRRKVHAF